MLARFELSDEDVERIAQRVAFLVERQRTQQKTEDPWLNIRQAADHLGMTVHALRHRVARRAVPYVQEAPNSKIYFRTSELDAWRAEQGRQIA